MADDGMRRRAGASTDDVNVPFVKDRGNATKSSGKKGLCSLCTCKLLANPRIWLLPAPFADVFKRAVGAARGNKQAKAHCLRVLQAWILVGALIIGLFIGMLDTGLGTGIGGEGESLFDQIFGFACIFGSALSLAGPIIMSSVLYLCISSVDDNNFDLFFATARSFFSISETLTWLMCLDCFFCLGLLPFVMFTDRDKLVDHAPSVDFLNGIIFAYISMALVLILAVSVIWNINALVLATLHAGLLTRKRVDNDTVWDGSHGAHDRVVDAVVKKALKHQDVEKMLKYLVQIRGKDDNELYQTEDELYQTGDEDDQARIDARAAHVAVATMSSRMHH